MINPKGKPMTLERALVCVVLVLLIVWMAARLL